MWRISDEDIYLSLYNQTVKQGKALSSISIGCLHAIHHLGQIFIVYPMEEETIKEEGEDNKALQSRVLRQKEIKEW